MSCSSLYSVRKRYKALFRRSGILVGRPAAKNVITSQKAPFGHMSTPYFLPNVSKLFCVYAA